MAGLATASMVLDALLLWGEWNLVNRDGFPMFVGWICGIAAAAILMLLAAAPWLARHHPETLFPDSEVVDTPAGHR